MLACKKESLVCDNGNEVVYDENFILFPKTGGLWIYYRKIFQSPYLVIDSITTGEPYTKLAYSVPFGSYYVTQQTLTSTPENRTFYPLIRRASTVDSSGNIVASSIDTIFSVREDISEKRVYRTFSSNQSVPDTVFEMVYMDYDLAVHTSILSRDLYGIYDYSLTQHTINSYDSIYFNKRYLKRYFTQWPGWYIIQGFDVGLGVCNKTSGNLEKVKKIFIYKGDSIVQNF